MYSMVKDYIGAVLEVKLKEKSRTKFIFDILKAYSGGFSLGSCMKEKNIPDYVL